jgi:hypothetical protein
MGDNLEGQSVQAVAGEDRRRLAEGLVSGRLAAAEVVVVHRRQIVMDQRIDVNRFDGGGDPQGALRVDGEEASGGHGQERPEPLAATDRCMAHGFEQAVAAVSGRLQQG